MGGFIAFREKAAYTKIPSHHDGDHLKIGRWEIEHIYHNVEIPQSGNYGSETIERVGGGFRFVAAVDIDLLPMQGKDPAPGPNSQPFYDGRLEGPKDKGFQLEMKFQLGDPSFLEFPGAIPTKSDSRGIYYYCDGVVLDRVRTVNPVRVPGVVTCIIEGRGSRPLQRYVASEWCGAGVFGFTEQQINARPV